MITPLSIKGFKVYPGYLDSHLQSALVEGLRLVAKDAPFVRPVTPGGKEMSVRMTSAGAIGWVTDGGGYRYQKQHPEGQNWPAIPDLALAVWCQLVGEDRLPDCCLVNYYDEEARMGMHQDKDEGDFDWPVVSISLGDEALFRMGNVMRGGKTESLWLRSGDVVVMGGDARLAYHGVDRIRFGSSRLLSNGGRINLTMRVVDQGKSEQQP